MNFDPLKSDLPIVEIIPQVIEHLAKGNTLIVNAPPGAGKSTLLPLALMNQPWLEGKKIILLEPRRLAARTVAARMASLIDDELGNLIGYRIRFDNVVSANTRLEVVTEGILTRMLHTDNELKEVGLVIFDEFHERSIHADVAMALCRESQQVLRPDLRILVMSATLDMQQLPKLLNCPTAESKGKQYPVDIRYTGQEDQWMVSELAAHTILKSLREDEGDILAFFPGEGEIKRCEEILRNETKGVQIHPLYGQLPMPKQRAAILPDKDGRRKVVLATSIAETSLTIEGIKVVVDSGYGRTSKFDPKSGLSRLETIRISNDSADQRAGRAGRLSPGICYRMWSIATQNRLSPHRIPEIVEADLASLMLDMAHWGVTNVDHLTWLTLPPKGTVAQAIDTLTQLNALENGKITEHGIAIHKLPCHPRIAHMLVKAEEEDLLPLATDLAALLEERDPMPKETGVDVNIRIEALRRFRNNNGKGGKFGRIEKIAQSYRSLFKLEPDNKAVDPYVTGFLMAFAYPERIGCARPGNNAQFQLANGRLASAHHKDDLAYEPWLAIANLDARDGMGKIFLASPLNPKDLAPLVKEREVIKWDTEDGGLIASKDMSIGSIILRSKPLPDPDESHLVQAICDAVKTEGYQLLNFSEDVTQWQNRVLSLKKWRPSENWQDVSTLTLLLTCKDWLAPYLTQVKTPSDLRKIDLENILKHSMTYEEQQLLDKLAPKTIKVPSGSEIELKYHEDGSAPILAVRLQELFGMADTPHINENKTPVLLHLLSPGYKPVQITMDLKNFWNKTYFDVKKDLKGRYPKHVWPDDPWKEEAIKGVKKKKIV